jgi:MFS family permease
VELSSDRDVGRKFGWLWGAFAVSAVGTWLAFDAFPLIAIIVLDAGPAEVSALAAVGLAAGAMLAVPLGPWVEFRRKRSVMVAMDLARFAALASVPVAYALGHLGLAQLFLVSILVGAADIAFRAASGAFLKALVAPADLLRANARFESTQWTATMLGPPLGGAMIGLLGPLATVATDAASSLLSALGIPALGAGEPAPARPARAGATERPHRGAELFAGWRHLLSHPTLRPLFLNAAVNNALVLASAPLLAVLMLGDLGFPPWQYGLAFAAPCLGGLVGSRLSARLVRRFGERRVLLAAGALRAPWSLGLAFVAPGPPGLLLVIVLELGLITANGVYLPVLVTYRLEQTEPRLVARALAAWSTTTSLSVATLTALWGVLAAATSPRAAIAAAGALLCFTPLLLPWRRRRPGDAYRSTKLERSWP